MSNQQIMKCYRAMLLSYFRPEKVLDGHLEMIVEYFEHRFKNEALPAFKKALQQYITLPHRDYDLYRRCPELRHLKSYLPSKITNIKTMKAFGIGFTDAKAYHDFCIAYRCADNDRCAEILKRYCSADPYAQSAITKFKAQAAAFSDKVRKRQRYRWMRESGIVSY